MATFKDTMREIMRLAWQFVKRNGFTMSEALKCAWANIRLRAQLQKSICKFYFQKVDGSTREAWGTLRPDLLPPTQHNRKSNNTVQVYFDTECHEYRCFKKFNLVSIA